MSVRRARRPSQKVAVAWVLAEIAAAERDAAEAFKAEEDDTSWLASDFLPAPQAEGGLRTLEPIEERWGGTLARTLLASTSAVLTGRSRDASFSRQGSSVADSSDRVTPSSSARVSPRSSHQVSPRSSRTSSRVPSFSRTLKGSVSAPYLAEPTTPVATSVSRESSFSRSSETQPADSIARRLRTESLRAFSLGVTVVGGLDGPNSPAASYTERRGDGTPPAHGTPPTHPTPPIHRPGPFPGEAPSSAASRPRPAPPPRLRRPKLTADVGAAPTELGGNFSDFL
jgi:hypothetical protein